jgi:hypothetical protein
MITRCAPTYLCLSSCDSLVQWTTKPLGGSLSYFTIMLTNWAFVRDADDWVAMCRKKFLLELNFASGRVNEENLSWPLEKALLAHLWSPILTVTYLLTGRIRGDANGAPC